MRLPFQRLLLRRTPLLLSIWVGPVFPSLSRLWIRVLMAASRARGRVLLFVVTTRRPFQRWVPSRRPAPLRTCRLSERRSSALWNLTALLLLSCPLSGAGTNPVWPASSYAPITDPLFPPSEQVPATLKSSPPRVFLYGIRGFEPLDAAAKPDVFEANKAEAFPPQLGPTGLSVSFP